MSAASNTSCARVRVFSSRGSAFAATSAARRAAAAASSTETSSGCNKPRANCSDAALLALFPRAPYTAGSARCSARGACQTTAGRGQCSARAAP